MMAGRTSKSVSLPQATLVLLSCAFLSACSGPATSPEDAVREWVSAGAERAKNKDRRGLVAMISPNYTDARGNGRNDIEDLFRFYFLRAGSVALLTRIEELRVLGDSAAELVLTVGMAGTNDGVLGFSAEAYRFEMELERDGSEWLLIGARWAELGETPR